MKLDSIAGRLAGLLVALLLCFAIANLVQGQTGTGTVDVQLTVTATAGPLRCVITPSQAGTAASVNCTKAGLAVTTSTLTPAVDQTGIISTVSVPAGTGFDAITVLLKKTSTSSPVNWEVTANGVNRSGTF